MKNEIMTLRFDNNKLDIDFKLTLPDVSKYPDSIEATVAIKSFIYRFVYPLYTGLFYMIDCDMVPYEAVKYDKSKHVISTYLYWVDHDMTELDKDLILELCKENNITIKKEPGEFDMYSVINDISEYIGEFIGNNYVTSHKIYKPTTEDVL